MSAVTIYEVGPRDGLQNEKGFVATKDKIKLVDLLSATGLRKIEVTSFVSPKWVPQLADATDVVNGITRADNVTYAALTPNMKGFEAARDAGVKEVAIFAAASESFSKKNTNTSIKKSLERFAPIMTAAADADITVRGYVSCITHCPYEGAIKPSATASVSKALLDLGCYEVSLGDTIGHATPDDMRRLLDHLCADLPATQLAGHFHDTKGNAVGNVSVSLDFGIRVFDSSVSGLGGCPFAPGAKGNLSTSKLIKLLNNKGLDHGVDLDQMTKVETFVSTLNLGRTT